MQGKIVIIGAGGTGLSNIAGILRDLGFHNIIGIEEKESQITQQLKAKGMTIVPHGKYSIKAEDIIIYTSAAKDCDEIQQAKNLKREAHTPLMMWDYFSFLGEMSKCFRTIGVTGTNGKSSTTSLLVTLAKEHLEDFWLGIVGALVPDLGGKSYQINEEKKADLTNIFNYLFSGKRLDYTLIKKYFFIIESCEYQRHFLHINMEYSLITSLELEHTDYYHDRDDYQSAFLEMIDKTKETCFCLTNLKSEKVLQHPKVKAITPQHFEMDHLRGEHQQQNATLAFTLLNLLTQGKKEENIKKSLKIFHGIRRRMENLTSQSKEWNSTVQIFSDYGHVASSIQLGYQALRTQFPTQKIIGIFQPHQIQRIIAGRTDFPEAFKGYDEIYIYDIYAAREHLEDFKDTVLFQKNNIKTIQELGNCFANHCKGTYLKTFDDIKRLIEKEKKADEDTIIVFYSAGGLDFQMRTALHLL